MIVVYCDLTLQSLHFCLGLFQEKGHQGVELKSIKIRWVGVFPRISMDCTIKKDKTVLVVPPFSSSVPPQHLFSWNSPYSNCILNFDMHKHASCSPYCFPKRHCSNVTGYFMHYCLLWGFGLIWLNFICDMLL